MWHAASGDGLKVQLFGHLTSLVPDGIEPHHSLELFCHTLCVPHAYCLCRGHPFSCSLQIQRS